jgi:hypothetical protein
MRPVAAAGKPVPSTERPLWIKKARTEKKAVRPGERPYRQRWSRGIAHARLSGRKQDTASAAPNSYVEAKYLEKVNNVVLEPIFLPPTPIFYPGSARA